MARPTFEKYMRYLRAEPRTLGWGALLVYDRFRANRLWAQEHIQRFDDSEWLPPVNFRASTESGSWTEVRDLVMDKPRLSFVNSSIASSKARLSMNVVSGVITQLRQLPGSDQMELVSYTVLNPLGGPTVRMDITLNETNSGSIDDEGRVTLDLSTGQGYTFEVSSWKEMNEKLGEAVKAEFEKWPKEARVWELNIIKPLAGALNPQEFAVRTHSLARSQQITNATQEEQEEGAVIVGVSFVEDKTGTFPPNDKDMPYLLPSPVDGNDGPFTMNVLFANEVWLKDQLWQLVRDIPGLTNVNMDRDQSGFFSTVKADVGFTVQGRRDTTIRDYERYTFTTYTWPNLDFSGSFKIVHTDDVLVVEWAVECPTKELVVIFHDSLRDYRHDPDFNVSVSVQTELRIKMVGEGDKRGDIEIVPGKVEVNYNARFWGGDHSYINDYVKESFDDYIKPHIDPLVNQMADKVAVMASGIKPFNALRLNSLLFRSDEVATPRLLVTPGELSLLGDLAPKLTTFAVEPLEEKVSAAPGNTVKFHLDPAIGGTVSWSVKGLPDGSTDPEKVGAVVDGVYTPPEVGALTDSYRRVIVTATANGNSSSALVTVVADSVAIYPYFQIANFKSGDNRPRYVLTGGDIKGDLKWAMTSSSKGTVREVEAGDSDLDIPVDKNVRIYESPEKAVGEAGTVDALVHLDGVEVSAGGQTEVIDIVIPWRTTTAGLRTTAQAGGGLKLALYFDNEETGEEDELTPAETLWKVFKGAGQINPTTGIYTPGPNEGPYIIVAGRETPAERTPIWNYAVIPLSHVEEYEAFCAHVRTHNKQGEI